MRKREILLFIFLLLSLFYNFTIISAQEEARPLPTNTYKPSPKLANMKEYLGMKWGVTASYFHDNFKYITHMKIDKDAFISSNFKLKGVEYLYIGFYFTNDQGYKVINKDNARSWYLARAGAAFKSQYYSKLYDQYVETYGPPFSNKEGEVKDKLGKTYIQKSAGWISKSLNRLIFMQKYGTKSNYGLLIFNRASKTTR